MRILRKVLGGVAVGVVGVAVLLPRVGAAEGLPWPEEGLPELGRLLAAAMGEEGPALAARRAEVEMAAGGRVYQEAAGRPKVRLDGELFGRVEYRDDLEDDGFTASPRIYGRAEIEQPLFHFGAIEARRLLGRETERAAGLALAEGRRDVAMGVRRAYFDAVAEKAALVAADLRLERTDALVARLEREIGSGGAAESNLEAARLARAEEAARRAAVAHRLEARLAGLQMLCGVEVAAADLPLLDGPAVPGPGEPGGGAGGRAEVTAPPEAVRLRLEQAGLQAEAARQEAMVYARDRWPKIDAVGGVLQDDVPTVSDRAASTQAYAGVRGRWTIFDARQSEGLERQARARALIWEARGRQEAEQIRISLEEQRGAWREAAELAAVAARRIEFARGGVEKARRDEAAGITSGSGVLDARIELAEREAEFARYQGNALAAAAAWRALMEGDGR